MDALKPGHTASAWIAPPLLKNGQAAAYCGLSGRTFEALRRHRTGPAFVRISGRAIRYRREDLDAWIAERVIAAVKR